MLDRKKRGSSPETHWPERSFRVRIHFLALQPLMTRDAISTIGSSAKPIALFFMMIPAPLRLSATCTP